MQKKIVETENEEMDFLGIGGAMKTKSRSSERSERYNEKIIR